MWDFHLLHLMHSRHIVFWDQTILCSCWARRKISVLHSEPFLVSFGLFGGNFLFSLLSQFTIERLFILITTWWTQNIVNTEFCRCLFFLAGSVRRKIAGKGFFFPFYIYITFLLTWSKYDNVFVFNLFWVVFLFEIVHMNCFNSSDYFLPADYCLYSLGILIVWKPVLCWRMLLLQCALGLLHFTEISLESWKKGCCIVDSAFEEVYLGCVIWKDFFFQRN